MKWRYYRTGLYTEKKRSHWLKQWPISKGLGDKKGELSLVIGCALHYNKDKFSVLARARTSFHLSALEATFIKSLNPLLCKRKEFVYSLKIS